MTEFSRVVIDDPEFVRARDEFSIVVPAFYPCVFGLVQAEETGFVKFSTVVLDFTVFLAHLIVGGQEIFPEDLGVFDLYRRCHRNGFAFGLLIIHFVIFGGLFSEL